MAALEGVLGALLDSLGLEELLRPLLQLIHLIVTHDHINHLFWLEDICLQVIASVDCSLNMLLLSGSLHDLFLY
jgi:hypothetical protein